MPAPPELVLDSLAAFVEGVGTHGSRAQQRFELAAQARGGLIASKLETQPGTSLDEEGERDSGYARIVALAHVHSRTPVPSLDQASPDFLRRLSGEFASKRLARPGARQAVQTQGLRQRGAFDRDGAHANTRARRHGEDGHGKAFRQPRLGADPRFEEAALYEGHSHGLGRRVQARRPQRLSGHETRDFPDRPRREDLVTHDRDALEARRGGRPKDQLRSGVAFASFDDDVRELARGVESFDRSADCFGAERLPRLQPQVSRQPRALCAGNLERHGRERSLTSRRLKQQAQCEEPAHQCECLSRRSKPTPPGWAAVRSTDSLSESVYSMESNRSSVPRRSTE